MKTLTVQDETWKKLVRLKLDLDLQTIDDCIIKLFDLATPEIITGDKLLKRPDDKRDPKARKKTRKS